MTSAVLSEEALARGPLEILGHLRGASNGTYLVQLGDEADQLAVYKPVAGERPLWDFPEGTLGGREVAVRALDRLLGFDLVPTTVWRDEGPLGPGMCQQWIVESESEFAAVVDVVPEGQIPESWLRILRARDDSGMIVELVHADLPRLRDLALLDAVVNNADRKAGHVLVDSTGRIFGIDHGICLHAETKLRTVLWGWTGDALAEEHLRALRQLGEMLADPLPDVDRWLSAAEQAALRARVADLVASGTYPMPSTEWPAIPWPVF